MSVTDDERHHESKRSTVTSGNNRCTETSVPNLIHTLRHQRVRQVNRNHSSRERWEWEWMHEGNWRMSNCARPINVLITVHSFETDTQTGKIFCCFILSCLMSVACCLLIRLLESLVYWWPEFIFLSHHVVVKIWIDGDTKLVPNAKRKYWNYK